MIENGIDFDAVLAAGRIAIDVAYDLVSACSAERPKLAFG